LLQNRIHYFEDTNSMHAKQHVEILRMVESNFVGLQRLYIAWALATWQRLLSSRKSNVFGLWCVTLLVTINYQTNLLVRTLVTNVALAFVSSVV